jgi:hypothetical protein
MLEVEAAAGDLEELALQAQESRRLGAQAAQAAQAAEAAGAAQAAEAAGVGLGSTEASTSSEEEDDDEAAKDMAYRVGERGLTPETALVVASKA